MRLDADHFARRPSHSNRARPRLKIAARERARGHGAREPAPVHTDTESRYLDLDGDGLLDAVEVTETIAAVDPATGERRTILIVRTVAAGIEEDGAPRLVLCNSSPT
jgi:hypothetical protein